MARAGPAELDARALDFPLELVAGDVAVPLWDIPGVRGRVPAMWLREELLARGLAPRTADFYAREIRQADDFMRTRGTTLKACRAADVAAYCDTKPRTASTTKVTRAALAHYWAIVGRRGRWPTFAVPRLRKPKYQCRALEPADALLLEKEARRRGDDKGLAVLIGLYLGARREEIATLRWEHFDDGWVTIVGKGGTTRFCFLHPVLVDELEARRPPASGWLFPGRYRGRPVVPATVWSWVREVAASVGLEVTTHQLRHTNLAEMNDRTGDLRTTQEHAGHSRPDTTALYTRTTRRRLRAAVLSIDYARPLPVDV